MCTPRIDCRWPINTQSMFEAITVTVIGVLVRQASIEEKTTRVCGGPKLIDWFAQEMEADGESN